MLLVRHPSGLRPNHPTENFKRRSTPPTPLSAALGPTRVDGAAERGPWSGGQPSKHPSDVRRQSAREAARPLWSTRTMAVGRNEGRVEATRNLPNSSHVATYAH